MNNWETKRKFAIVEADDFMDQWDRNGLNFLFYWKAKYPKFKISLFTVPNRTTPEMIDLVMKHSDWIELLIHGWNHESNFECFGWSEEKTKIYIDRVRNIKYFEGISQYPAYRSFFKGPGWSITPGGPNDKGGSGYPAGEHDPTFEDPQAVYKGLRARGIVLFDRHYNREARLEDSNKNVVCVDCQPDLIHFHTWNVPSGDINQRNGFQDIEENFGVPWNQDTEFKFVSEAWDEGLFKECK